jgi:hypothetical protein
MASLQNSTRRLEWAALQVGSEGDCKLMAERWLRLAHMTVLRCVSRGVANVLTPEVPICL